jgi:single-stranded-DNA-specific exonuclease
MEKKWQIKRGAKKDKRIFPEMEEPMEKILLSRGFENEQQLESFFVPDYDNDLHDPFLLNDMKKAVNRTLKAQKNQEKVCIFGDYDADGVTGSVLLASFLKKELKLKVANYIPDREEEGYGMSKEAIDELKKEKISLIITVDCGITGAKEVEYAKKLGMEVIVLDHHDVVGEIPKALAVIDPKNPQEKKYPFRELAGVGVAFKFLQALSRKSPKIKEDSLKWYLDLVAVGTIADCVPLLDENRTLVKFGLMVLAKTKRAGFKQLFQIGRMEINDNSLPTAEQVAYQIAPRINAAGRMNHANLAFDLLVEKNELNAKGLAEKIEKENQNRQKVTNDILKNIKKKLKKKKNLPPILVEYSSDWRIGVIGLSAGKLAEEFARPVVLLQEKGEILRGSGRSIPGFNLVKAFEKQAHLLEKYGGHEQAAGLTLKKINFSKFKKAIEGEVKKEIVKKLVKTVSIDVKICLADVNTKFCEEISMLEPFGKENELPNLLIEKAKVLDKKLLGKDEKHLKIWIKGFEEGNVLEGIGFGMGEDSGGLRIGNKVDLVFNLEKNYWNGTKKLQLKLIDYKKSEV